MRLSFTAQGWDDYQYWQKTDKAMAKRINELIKNVLRTPFEGIGKPEPLKHELQGHWSRRISLEHRLVYLPKSDEVVIISCRYHYQ